MQEDQVKSNLESMDDLDFVGWNNADWNGVFAHHHTDDVAVDWKGQAPTHGIKQHIDAMKAYVKSAGGTPPQITSHPIAFGSGGMDLCRRRVRRRRPNGNCRQVGQRRDQRRIHLVLDHESPSLISGRGPLSGDA